MLFVWSFQYVFPWGIDLISQASKPRNVWIHKAWGTLVATNIQRTPALPPSRALRFGNTWGLRELHQEQSTSGKETIRWLGVTVGKKKSLRRMHHHPVLYAKRKKPKRKILAKNPDNMTPRQTPFLCLRFGDWSSSAKSWLLCVRAPGALGEVDLLLKSIDSKTVRRPSLKRAAGG